MTPFENFYLKIKLESQDAKMPTRAKHGDAGLDLYSPKEYIVPPQSDVLIPLNWSCEFPDGFVMVVKEKSGRATKDKFDIGACVVDSGYRGMVHVHIFNNDIRRTVIIKKGEKIAQAVVYPCWIGEPIEATSLSKSERGRGGFGSTGLK
jgi:dUTP pyrophosphatase